MTCLVPTVQRERDAPAAASDWYDGRERDTLPLSAVRRRTVLLESPVIG